MNLDITRFKFKMKIMFL